MSGPRLPASPACLRSCSRRILRAIAPFAVSRIASRAVLGADVLPAHALSDSLGHTMYRLALRDAAPRSLVARRLEDTEVDHCTHRTPPRTPKAICSDLGRSHGGS